MTKANVKKDVTKGTELLKKMKTTTFCGEYLLDYKMATKSNVGDMVTIKSIIENPRTSKYNNTQRSQRPLTTAKLHNNTKVLNRVLIFLIKTIQDFFNKNRKK
jgi:hypothetical protein